MRVHVAGQGAASQPVSQETSQSVGGPVSQSVGGPVSQLVGEPVSLSVVPPVFMASSNLGKVLRSQPVRLVTLVLSVCV